MILKIINRQFFFDFLIIDLAARKRYKKDHDKTWMHEERRGCGDHRRSAGFRRGSGSRHCGPDDSDEGSPPPSLSDGKRFCTGFA